MNTVHPYTRKLRTSSRNGGMKPLQQLQPRSGCENYQPESQTRSFTPCADRNVFHTRLLTSMLRLFDPDSLTPHSPAADSHVPEYASPGSNGCRRGEYFSAPVLGNTAKVAGRMYAIDENRPAISPTSARTRDAGACLDWPAGRPMVESRPLGGVMKLVNIADLKSAA